MSRRAPKWLFHLELFTHTDKYRPIHKEKIQFQQSCMWRSSSRSKGNCDNISKPARTPPSAQIILLSRALYSADTVRLCRNIVGPILSPFALSFHMHPQLKLFSHSASQNTTYPMNPFMCTLDVTQNSCVSNILCIGMSFVSFLLHLFRYPHLFILWMCVCVCGMEWHWCASCCCYCHRCLSVGFIKFYRHFLWDPTDNRQRCMPHTQHSAAVACVPVSHILPDNQRTCAGGTICGARLQT